MERDEGNGGDSGESFASKMKKEGTAFGTSIWEGWQQTKATIIAQVKKMRARNEKEASDADLQASKIQVEAADEAENKKKQIGM
ncbi:hypothetical protein ACMD2_06761 [Ananas comosus]|uniref:Uncharacterized protein n=1 Tax=Ananas comosus TaxID=4615 RepID=A0A199VV47_ANACO|nr:hypothetical protein ACMD2_06761 [Ananas comosus]